MITPLPDAPSRSDTAADFVEKADAFVAALPGMVTEINATSAGFDVSLWVTGTSYVVGNLVWSPTNYRTYRRKTNGAGSTDPASDTTNWADVNFPAAGGSNGQALAFDSAQTTGTVAVDNPSRPNLIINPNWLVDQINEGALYTVNAADVRGPDGWSGTAVGAGVFKLRTLADPDNAALRCMEITCTTADASLAATDDYFIYSAIEGYDASALMSGTASAGQVTVQFKFKSNVTGVYGVSLANSAKNRSNYQIITVADANEHEYSLTFTLDTTGTWLYTNGVGLYLAICLAAGSNFQGTAGAWAADSKQTTTAQANFMSVNTNVAYLKRVQLIQGGLVQAYKPADIERELARTKRYYEKSFSVGTAVAQSAGTVGAAYAQQIGAAGTGGFFPTLLFSTLKRASPTVTFYNPAAANAQARNISIAADNSATATGFINDTGFSTGFTSNGGSGALQISAVHWTANARLS